MVKVMGSSPVESTLRSMKIDKIYVLAINHTQEKINDIISRLEAAEFEPGTNYTIITGHNAYEDEIAAEDGVERGLIL